MLYLQLVPRLRFELIPQSSITRRTLRSKLQTDLAFEGRFLTTPELETRPSQKATMVQTSNQAKALMPSIWRNMYQDTFTHHICTQTFYPRMYLWLVDSRSNFTVTLSLGLNIRNWIWTRKKRDSRTLGVPHQRESTLLSCETSTRICDMSHSYDLNALTKL